MEYEDDSFYDDEPWDYIPDNEVEENEECDCNTNGCMKCLGMSESDFR